MKTGEIIFIVVVVAVAILVTVLKGKLPAWLGFILMLAASVAAIVGGAAIKEFKVIPVGAAGVICTIIAWVAGAVSKPATNPDLPGDDDRPRRDDPDTLGGVASKITLVPWLIIAALVVAAVVVTFFIP